MKGGLAPRPARWAPRRASAWSPRAIAASMTWFMVAPSSAAAPNTWWAWTVGVGLANLGGCARPLPLLCRGPGRRPGVPPSRQPLAQPGPPAARVGVAHGETERPLLAHEHDEAP